MTGQVPGDPAGSGERTGVLEPAIDRTIKRFDTGWKFIVTCITYKTKT